MGVKQSLYKVIFFLDTHGDSVCHTLGCITTTPPMWTLDPMLLATVYVNVSMSKKLSRRCLGLE